MKTLYSWLRSELLDQFEASDAYVTFQFLVGTLRAGPNGTEQLTVDLTFGGEVKVRDADSPASSVAF